MEIHLKTILKKMFDSVGEDSSDIEIYVKDPHWFLKKEWTKDQEADFKLWFVKYLKENKSAISELGIKFKSKYYLLKAVDQFIWNYGWKYKNENIQDSI